MLKKSLFVRNAKNLSSLFSKRQPTCPVSSGPVALISNAAITKLEPLKPRGFAKSGNISLSGELSGRKVKVSSMFTALQADLRKRFSNMSSEIHLPRVLASEGRMIVEEWIDGPAPSRADRKKICTAIREYLACDQRFSYRQEDICDFDYLDYLEQRVSNWHFIEGLGAFLERWRTQRAALFSELRLGMCNPDLSFENFKLEAGTGRIVMIDTEFLHVGQGWFMDHLNSTVRAEPAPIALSSELSLFARNCVALRQIGSALIVGRPDQLTPELLEFHDD